MEYMYEEPIRGEVYRYKVIGLDAHVFALVVGDHYVQVFNRPSEDGSYAADVVSGVVWPDTQEWRDKYQDSLSLRVSQHQLRVYFIEAVKRGKKNSRVLVIDGQGVTYTLLVPTVPMPQVGQSIQALRFDLTTVSLYPNKELLERVAKAKAEDPSLV